MNHANPPPWDEIIGFASPGHFERFQTWVEEAVAEGVLIPVPTDEPWAGDEYYMPHWYRRAGTEETWRFEVPDPPDHGSFTRVDFEQVARLKRHLEENRRSVLGQAADDLKKELA